MYSGRSSRNSGSEYMFVNVARVDTTIDPTKNPLHVSAGRSSCGLSDAAELIMRHPPMRIPISSAEQKSNINRRSIIHFKLYLSDDRFGIANRLCLFTVLQIESEIGVLQSGQLSLTCSSPRHLEWNS